MRIHKLGSVVACASLLLVAALAVPRPAAAQCGMMGGGGGHDHSTMHGQNRSKPSASQKKLQQSIDRVLSSDQGRAMLTDALLNDRSFVEAFVLRLATIPELRAVAVNRLQGGPTDDAPGGAGSSAPDAVASLYVCPMHSDVRSSTPGECSKCGMALVRTVPEHK